MLPNKKEPLVSSAADNVVSFKVLSGIVTFQGRYIAEPYWPETAHYINILKESGMQRARSEQSRQKALTAHLSKIRMTMEEFENLIKLSQRQFFTADDLEPAERINHKGDEIIIPADRWLAAFAHAADECPAAVRAAKPDNIRSLLRVGPFFTGKLKADGTWVRPVIPKKDGKPISNQRGTRTSYYIENFSGRLTVHFNARVKVSDLGLFIQWCGREIGIGASRKMDCGRFTVTWDSE